MLSLKKSTKSTYCVHILLEMLKANKNSDGNFCADETLTELCCRIEMYMKYIKNSEGYFKNVGSIEIETEENIENSALGIQYLKTLSLTK